jgi:hypothetical protein
MEKARSMMTEAQAPKDLCREALMTSTALRSVSPVASGKKNHLICSRRSLIYEWCVFFNGEHLF